MREHKTWAASVPWESCSCSPTWAVIDDITNSKLENKIMKTVPATMELTHPSLRYLWTSPPVKIPRGKKDPETCWAGIIINGSRAFKWAGGYNCCFRLHRKTHLTKMYSRKGYGVEASPAYRCVTLAKSFIVFCASDPASEKWNLSNALTRWLWNSSGIMCEKILYLNKALLL